MIPLRDDNPTSTTPIVTYALIAINVAVFVLFEGFGTNLNNPAVSHYMMRPGAIAHGRSWSTIFTSMFMHEGFLHIGGNMLYLWIFGDNVEDLLGPVKYLAFYLACGVAAAMAQVASGPNSWVPTLGASGAIAGVLGGYIMMWPRSSVQSILTLGFFWFVRPIPAWFVLGLWFGLQIISRHQTGPGGGGVAYYAHIGGFLTGLVLVRLLAGSAQPQRYGRWDGGR